MGAQMYDKPDNFLGKFPTKIEMVKQAPHSDHPTAQGTCCRKMLFTQHCSPRAREFLWSVNVLVRRTVSELRGVKFAQFFAFLSIFPIQNAGKVLKQKFYVRVI